MPIVSITTTAVDVFFGGPRLTAVAFKNGSSTGTIYIRYKPQSNAVVSSTDYEISLAGGASASFSEAVDGNGIAGPWQAISDTGGGVTLEVLPIYLDSRKE